MIRSLQEGRRQSGRIEIHGEHHPNLLLIGRDTCEKAPGGRHEASALEAAAENSSGGCGLDDEGSRPARSLEEDRPVAEFLLLECVVRPEGRDHGGEEDPGTERPGFVEAARLKNVGTDQRGNPHAPDLDYHGTLSRRDALSDLAQGGVALVIAGDLVASVEYRACVVELPLAPLDERSADDGSGRVEREFR